MLGFSIMWYVNNHNNALPTEILSITLQAIQFQLDSQAASISAEMKVSISNPILNIASFERNSALTYKVQSL